MTDSLFEKLDALEGGEEVEIEFGQDGPIPVGDMELENPLRTTVEITVPRRLDPQEGHDVDDIVTETEIHLEVPNYDDQHDEYVITTERPMAGENSYSPIEARDYFEGRAGDGRYAIHPVGFSDVTVID